MKTFAVTFENEGIPYDYEVDAPDAATATKWATKTHSDFMGRVGKQREQDRETYDPTKGMGMLEKARANYGAGGSSLAMGVKQLLGGDVSDDEIREKRERDSRLADSTQVGMGGKYVPSIGTALQFAGETAPSVVIPGGVAGNVAGKVGGSVLAKTILPLAVGAAGGAGSAALSPVTSDESRGKNMLIGGAAGTLLPGAVGLYKAGKKYLTRPGARLEAGQKLGMTPDMPLRADPATATVRGAENVPLSTAATYGDDALAGAELTSRARGKAQADWADFDRAQREAVWENVETGTKRAGSEGKLRGERQDRWQEDTARAMKNVKPRIWQREYAQLRSDIDTALKSPEGQNQMRPVLTEIARQMDELGPGFTPQHLAQLRSRMSGSVRGSPTDPFTSAPVSDPSFISLKQGFDDILDRTTGGRWNRVPEGYRESSVPVAQAKAETSVQRHFLTPEGTPRGRTSPEGTPQVTEAGLRKAITLPEMQNKIGNAPTFAPDSQRVLKGTLEAMERQGITTRAKLAQTAGGGSNTAPLQAAMTQLDPSMASNAFFGAMRYARNFADKRALQELDQALIDPQHYYKIMQETIAAGKPLTIGQRALLHGAAVAGRSEIPNLMQPSQEAR